MLEATPAADEDTFHIDRVVAVDLRFLGRSREVWYDVLFGLGVIDFYVGEFAVGRGGDITVDRGKIYGASNRCGVVGR